MTVSLAEYAKANPVRHGPICRVCQSGKHAEIVREIEAGVPLSVVAEWLIEVHGIKASSKALAQSVRRHLQDGHGE